MTSIRDAKRGAFSPSLASGQLLRGIPGAGSDGDLKPWTLTGTLQVGKGLVEEVTGHQFPAASIAFNAVAIGK